MVCFFDFTLTFRHGGILVNGNKIYLTEAVMLIGTGIRWGVRTYRVATRDPNIYRTALAIQSGRQISLKSRLVIHYQNIKGIEDGTSF